MGGGGRGGAVEVPKCLSSEVRTLELRNSLTYDRRGSLLTPERCDDSAEFIGAPYLRSA